ncbi:MAG TPA: hypothetical protein VHY08_20070 [Bacillota bacterium]|nr:hypothetical protein [Bacillota bacterium]
MKKTSVLLIPILILLLIGLHQIYAKSANSFYGAWVVNRQLATGPVYALSDEEINNLIGKTIYYSATKAAFGNKVCQKPFYKIQTVPEDDFLVDNKLYLKEVGINRHSITMVEIYTDQSAQSFWGGYGSIFYPKSKNQIIMNMDGVWFELMRKK